MAAAKSMDAGFRLDCDTPDTVAVSGALSFATATAVLDALREVVRGGARRQLDLSAVSGCDSAGLACVLAVLAESDQQGHPLHVRHVPAGMQALAQVCGVGQWV
jgi:phospholipid transport system transporter-binding protein